MRTLAKGSTLAECHRRVRELEQRGWTPLHEPKNITEIRSLKWVVTLEKPDVPHNPKNIARGIKLSNGYTN